ncbi:GNAT family N-acetyltransferase [Thermoactinomyces mirandus]|uniref:GNAT family N-acetyltransferase n=1 Tax=Thermoactinomyces mirandus TaxID=2756294 RepID=A0A7W2ASD1_9BACL|nr:GNAT family N-acetyltransferase [Thermoactinomyces mirandus]MBA4603503.1 GNAT family N-acetyltransferase [Thermoactinomyces mirandus]
MDIQKNIDEFIRGWMVCRFVPDTSLSTFQSIRHVHFGKPVGGRTDEFFVSNLSPRKTVEQIHKYHPNMPHWLTVFSDFPEQTVAEYQSLGYLFSHTEYLMARSLSDFQSNRQPVCVRRILDQQKGLAINRYFGKEAINIDSLANPHLYQYCVMKDELPVAYGRFSLVSGVACLDNIFTSPMQRGKGVGKSLVQTMLACAREAGAVRSVLAASEMGQPMYLKLGYSGLIHILIFQYDARVSDSIICRKMEYA